MMVRGTLLLACFLTTLGGLTNRVHADDPPTQAVPVTTDVYPLVRALNLDMENLAQYDIDLLLDAAEWLHTWAFMGQDAPVSGTTEEYLAAKYRAKEILYHARERSPERPRVYSLLAGMNYGIGELLPEDDRETRMQLYEEMIEVATHCVENVDPDSAACWHELGVGIGRASTTRGVMASLFAAKDVEKAWLRALELQPTHVALNGDPLASDTRYGLGVFYRLVPDSWFVKLFAGVRGDSAKAVSYFREAVAEQPNRLELQKELAVALLCHGYHKKDDASLKEARALLGNILAGKYDVKDHRATDDIDRRHAQILLDVPPKQACGYSRDGFQEIDEEALEKHKQ